MEKVFCKYCGRPLELKENKIAKLMNEKQIEPAPCMFCVEQKKIENMYANYKRLFALYKDKTFLKYTTVNQFSEAMTFQRSRNEYEGAEDPFVKKFKDKLKQIKEIFIDLGAHFEILDMVYSDKLKFIKKNCNFLYFTHNAEINYVVIKLQGLIGKNQAQLSLRDLCDFVSANTQQLFNNCKIYDLYEFDGSKDAVRVRRPEFQIKELIILIKSYLDRIKDELEQFNTARHEICCHITDERKKPKLNEFSYLKIKGFFNTFYLFFNAISFAQDTTQGLMYPDQLSHRFSDLLKKHNLKHIRLHDLRHSCATLLKRNNVNIKDIQIRLGHANYNFTADTYVHVDNESKDDCAKILSKSLNSKEQNKLVLNDNELVELSLLITEAG